MIITVLLTLFAACVVAAVGIDIYYFQSLPRTPDEGAGRTFRMVVSHGSIRYGSAREFRILKMVEGLFPISSFLPLAALVLGLRYNHFQIRRGATT